MSSNQEESATTEFTEEVSQLALPPGIVADLSPSVANQLETPSLPTLNLPPPLPPRFTHYHPRSLYLPSHSSSPQPALLTPSQPVHLPPFCPLSPIRSQTVPALRTDPFVTPGSSPGHHSSVISCPTSCDNLHSHQTPVFAFPPRLLQPSHNLGEKIVSKFRYKHQLVSTSVSSLEADNSLTCPLGVVLPGEVSVSIQDKEVFGTVNMAEGDDTMEMDRTSKELRRKQQIVRDYIGDFEEDDVELMRVPTVERDLDRILEKRDDFRSCVREFLEDYSEQLDTSAQNTWKDCITNINNEVKVHAKKIRAKVHEVCPPAIPLTEFEKQQLEIQMKQLALLEANASKQHDSSALHSQAEKAKVLALAKKKYDAFLEESAALTDISAEYPVEKLTDPKKCLDQDISSLMRNVSGLKTSLRDLTKSYNTFQEVTIVHKLSGNLMDNIELEMETTRNAINALIAAVEKEDKERNIRALDHSKYEQRKFKTFSGAQGEDYLYFKKDFEEAVIANRISRSNQLEKLRENLNGEALKQVPHNMTGGLQSAWYALQAMFGDPERLLKFRLKALEELGKFPLSMKGGQPNYASQSTWLAPFLVELNEIISLGETHQELENTVFNSSTINNVINRFTEKDDLNMLDMVTGRDKDRLLGIKAKLETLKAKTIRFSARTCSDPPAKVPPIRDPKRNGGAAGPANLGEVRGMTIFKNPQRFAECRICDLFVGAQNPPAALHENHLSDWVTGCPVFMMITTPERFRRAREAEFCINCFDKNIRFSNAAHISKDINQPVQCMVTKDSKHRYSCLDKTCLNHMWICRKHKKLNEPTMKKQQARIKTSGASFNFPVGSPPIRNSTPVKQLVPTQQAIPEYVPTNIPDSIRKISSHVKISEAVNAMSASTKSRSTDSAGKPSHSLEKQKISRKVRKRSVAAGNSFIPVPKGSPMFMFQGVEGKKKSVKWFYDSGCSHLCMKNDIPQTEFDSTLLQKGPFNIGGVGGLKVVANDEYLISVKRADGRKQHFQGVTMDNITSEFPMVNLEAATAEVKNSDPSNSALQKCSVPPSVGGHVDVLGGIKYLSSFPELVHMLDSGLGIYKCRLASHDKRWNALIGGSHESFDCLAQKSGNVGYLLANFVDGLKAFRATGPPKLSRCPMTLEEELFAKARNAEDTELKDIRDLFTMETAEVNISKFLSDQKVKVVSEPTEEFSNNDNLQKAEESVGDCSSSKLVVFYCQDCTMIDLDNSSNISAMVSDDSIWELKGLMREVESSGLDVDYRCVRCRSCSDCQNADHTDKTSLREEQELQQCMDSVELDKVNKKVKVSLPLRGPERDFLVTNRDSAEQILIQQCKKYSSNIEIKERILKAFEKVFTPGFLIFLEDLDEETRNKFIDKEVQYYIPWRIQFSKSISTPERPVFDASTRTRRRPDKSGGRCLNDLVCKGVVKTIMMIRLLLRFSVGTYAINADIKQFYYCGKLIPTQWNLQRFVYKDDLDPDKETKEGVITTIINGVKSASCQLAESIKEEKPDVAVLLTESTYVDDIGESKASEEDCLTLMTDTDEVLASIGCEVKAWVKNGEDPSDKVSKDGISVEVGGQVWFPKLDIYGIKVPQLHFGNIVRGKIKEGTKFFLGGTMADLDVFFPKKLSKRQVTSKLASIFDPRAKLAPILAAAKYLLRQTNAQTVGWDDPMPANLRSKWVETFWRYEQLRGLRFNRPIMPIDAKNTKMRLLVGADAAEPMIMVGAWGGFERADGDWSCQHLLGRNIMASENSTIPKLELEGLCGASNMKWIIRRALHDWVDSEMVFGDSRIALCWTTSENRRLGIFHKARVLQIKRGTQMDKLFHVRSDYNPCDTGTRPDKLTLQSVGPESRWELGSDWMRRDLAEALAADIIKPALELRVNPEDENDFNDGCIFEKPEILTRGHVLKQGRITKIEERATFSKYLVLPTKFSFPTVVRIYAMVIKFARNCSKNKKILKHLISEANLQFSVFSSFLTDQEEFPDPPSDELLSMALTYLYQKGSKEVKEFNSSTVVKKYTVEKNDILFSKGRLIDGMTLMESGGLDIADLGELGINVKVPVLDRYSPLSYSIADHVHWKLTKHKGMETCSRKSLEKVHILQGPALYREIGEECIMCKKKRKHFIEVSMGPVSQHQLAVAPPIWAAQLDLFGPCTVYVPGYERETRGRKALATEVHVMVFACPSTRLVNLQVIEGKSTGCILDGITRLSCEIGIPKYLLIDDDDGIKKALRELEVDIRDLKHQLHREKGIVFEVCPVSGHNQHGQVERVIRSIQESLNDCGVQKLRLHATSLQTFAKLVENTYNNAPIGYSYGRDADNGPILKTISPNMMRVGRNNERALEGNFRLPVGGYEMVEKVDKLYQAWYKLWKDSVIPKLIRQPKWFKTDKHLQKGDLVYFEKDPSKLSSVWIMGRVDQVIRGDDGLIREATVAYRNHGENFNRITNRAVRSLVKIFSIDEGCVQDDLAELQKRINKLSGQDEHSPAGQDRTTTAGLAEQTIANQAEQEVTASEMKIYQVTPANQPDAEESEPELTVLDPDTMAQLNIQRKITKCKQCCCLSHCQVANHHTVVWKKATEFTNPFKKQTVVDIIDVYENEDNHSPINNTDSMENNMGDGLTSLLMNLNIRF